MSEWTVANEEHVRQVELGTVGIRFNSHYARKLEADRLWDHAEEISIEAGYQYYDCHGCNHPTQHSSRFVAEVVGLYLDRCGKDILRL